MVRIRGPETNSTFYSISSTDDAREQLVVKRRILHSDGSPDTVTEAAYTVDKIFGPEADDAKVFCEMEPLLENARHGAHIVLVAYGRSGTGKSKSIHGLLQNVSRTVWTEQQGCHIGNDGPPLEVSVSELYKDGLFDLLAVVDKTKSAPHERYRRQKLDFKTTSRRLVVPISMGAHAASITTSDSLMRILSDAERRRQTASTDVNAASSRSHAFITLVLPPPPSSESPSSAARGSITFVDLAGQERASANGAAEEAKSINQGLTALNGALRRLVEQQQRSARAAAAATAKKKGAIHSSSSPMLSSPEALWLDSQQLLPRIVGGLMVYGGAGGGQPKSESREDTKKLKAKICLLATVDLRDENVLKNSVATLEDLMSASGLKTG